MALPAREAMSTPVETSEQAEHRAESGLDLDRIIFFSDAVFAISITLLVLDVTSKVPQIVSNLPVNGTNHELYSRLLQPTFMEALLGYVISFLVTGLFWVAHHRIFRF